MCFINIIKSGGLVRFYNSEEIHSQFLEWNTGMILSYRSCKYGN